MEVDEEDDEPTTTTTMTFRKDPVKVITRRPPPMPSILTDKSKRYSEIIFGFSSTYFKLPFSEELKEELSNFLQNRKETLRGSSPFNNENSSNRKTTKKKPSFTPR